MTNSPLTPALSPQWERVFAPLPPREGLGEGEVNAQVRFVP
jgi:hypothetical protein